MVQSHCEKTDKSPKSLDTHLALRSFITGYALSTPDIAIWGALRGNRVAAAALKRGTLINLTRWCNFVEDLCPWALEAVDSINAAAREAKATRSRAGASYDIALKVSVSVFRQLLMILIPDDKPNAEYREWCRH